LRETTPIDVSGVKIGAAMLVVAILKNREQ